MSRPKSKGEILELSNTNYTKVLDLVNSLSPDDQDFEFPKEYLNRNIKDVFAHLHHWHLMLIGWYEVGVTGVKPAMPADGYSWKDLPALNKEIQERYKDLELQEARALLDKTHQKVHEIIEKHTEEELFEKKKYPWTGSTSMAAYFISATSSHYDWALKLIRKCLKVRES